MEDDDYDAALAAFDAQFDSQLKPNFELFKFHQAPNKRTRPLAASMRGSGHLPADESLMTIKKGTQIATQPVEEMYTAFARSWEPADVTKLAKVK
ncbi:hypothetical protein NDU88_006240 [Pleurodeles waltl]|uniref:Uncharacterized protein n=1 Tax=Pleurodeles waltl TaxID=8319 RepID=A0AAV7QKL3_PLEWA|nr:hypothetical protein NDU88_006240 [Pleurodeles waltl]